VSSNFAILQVNGLRPGTNYTVRAFVVEGSTQGQAKVSTVTTKADVPSGPVRGLTTSSISSRSVVLTWNAPEDKYINSGNGLTGYYVELRRFEGNRCEGKVKSTNVTPNRRSVTFNSLQPATRYCVIVFPENEGGRARELHASGGKTTFTTQQDAPSDSPTLRLVQPQFTQLTLAWDEPSQPNGQLTQYVIQYRQGSGRWVEITVSASAKYKLFTSGFDSGSRYQVRIAAVNAAGRGPFSTPVQFTMRPPVYDIGVCRLSSTSAKFVWKLRSQPSMGGELTQLRFTLSSSGQRKEYTVDKTSSGIERGGLMNKEYRLSVVLVWSEGDRLYFQPDSKDLGRLQTDPNCFPTKPRNLVAERVNPRDFTVSWSEPSTTNGPLLKYITTANSNTFEGMSTRLTVSGLEEAVQYTVKVRAVNKFGEGPNAVLSVRTKDSAPSGPARNIRVERISTTAIEVTWNNPDPEHINAVGGITGYKVVIGSRDCRGESKKTKNTTNLKVVFDGLKPGTVGGITGYRVVIGNRKCTTELQTWTVQDNVNTVRFGSLEPGGRYCVRIYPFNNDGPAPESIVKDSAVTTKLPDLLDAPKLVGTALGDRAALLWSEVVSTDEENPVINYIVYPSDGSLPIVLPPTARHHNMFNLTKGETYTVKVAAKSGLGEGRKATFNFTT
jgi:hypothetical protein